MDRGNRWWLLLPPGLRALPADLAAVVAAVLLTALAVFVPVVNETPLRVVLGLPFVLFVPGYALIAALFPEAGSPPDEPTSDDEPTAGERSGIDGIERVALSFGLSIAVVPLIGLVLNFTPFGIRLVPIVVAVSGVTLACTWLAHRRRAALPAADRFAVPYRDWLAAARAELLEPDTRTDAALNVLLAVSVVLAVASVGYAVAVPKQGEAFTELYVLTETDDGELIADDYPSEFVRGQPQPLVVGVGNHEHRPMNYSIVVELQRVTITNTTVTVEETDRLATYDTGTIRDGGNWTLRHQVRPEMVGTELRLTYLLYRGDPPPVTNVTNAYRENHLFVNVTEAEAA